MPIVGVPRRSRTWALWDSYFRARDPEGPLFGTGFLLSTAAKSLLVACCSQEVSGRLR
jgi:hypothetical protein